MLIPLLTLLVGLIVGYFLAHHQVGELKRQHTENLQHQEQQYAQHLAELRQQVEHEEEQADKRIAELQHQYAARLAELQQQHRQEMEQHIALIKEQLKSSTEAVLKERSQELSAANSEQLAKVLNPLQTGIRQMQEAVEKSQQAHTEGLARLDQSFKLGMEQAQRIGERADRLTNALTAENKSQGNFGELQLRQLLEQMGLEPGVQFTEQATLRDDDGRTLHNADTGQRMQPDVILHFPDERDVVIDAKVSLTAYVDYQNATDDAARDAALQRHLVSVRQHVKELAGKNYSAYIHTGRVRLDYVIMYIPYESAFLLALQADPSLYSQAFSQGVMITSTQNLYALLRMIEISWRQQRQVQNQENIMKAAATIVERVQRFYERFLAVQEQLTKTQRAFSDLSTTIAPTGPSIITSAHQLIKYGAQKPKASKAGRELPTPADEDAEALPADAPAVPSDGSSIHADSYSNITADSTVPADDIAVSTAVS